MRASFHVVVVVVDISLGDLLDVLLSCVLSPPDGHSEVIGVRSPSPRWFVNPITYSRPKAMAKEVERDRGGVGHRSTEVRSSRMRR